MEYLQYGALGLFAFYLFWDMKDRAAGRKEAKEERENMLNVIVKNTEVIGEVGAIMKNVCDKLESK